MPEVLGGGSSLVARIGYNSNILALGAPLELGQFGIAPGATYYHKTGLYLDATAYWSQIYSPSLYLTVASLGYLKSVKKWTVNAEYSRYFYSVNDSLYNSPYTNTLSVTNYLAVKPLLFRLDYGLYFGGKTAHRLTPALMVNLEKRNWLGIDRILIYPSVSVLFGTESWQLSQYVAYTTAPKDVLYRIRHNQPLYYLQNNNQNEFGVLNYAITLPVSMSIKNFSLLASYTYNFPQRLPDEPAILNNGGYLSVSVIHYFHFKSNHSLIDFYKLAK